MSLSSKDFEELRAKSRDYALNFLRQRNLQGEYELVAAFLYGSAAKYHLGMKPAFGDFDITAVFRALEPKSHRTRISTRWSLKNLPPYKGKAVQIMRNIYTGSAKDAATSVLELATRMRSEGWKSIRANPVILLYPEIKVLWDPAEWAR